MLSAEDDDIFGVYLKTSKRQIQGTRKQKTEEELEHVTELR